MTAKSIALCICLFLPAAYGEVVTFSHGGQVLCDEPQGDPFCDFRDEDAGKHALLDALDALGKETRGEGSRWARIEYQLDSRGFNVVHAMGSSPLPLGFHLWGFIDIEGTDSTNADREDLARYFLEIDLRKQLISGGGLIAEVNDLHGDGNALGRLGFYYQPKAKWLQQTDGLLAGKGFLFFKIFPYGSNDAGAQASVAYNKNFDNFLDGRYSMGGFFDMNFDAGGREVIVSEHQVRFRVMEGFHLMVEFRLNQFINDDFGIAPSIQYRF